MPTVRPLPNQASKTTLIAAKSWNGLSVRNGLSVTLKWVKELQMYLPQDTPIIITGNKCDIPNRQIPVDEAER